ncbi:MAG: ABC transporter ATP-binding protein [Chloroflexi bacterium]|nr:ABC transporter ATP-binding protein [Chloroflexota bacterium]
MTAATATKTKPETAAQKAERKEDFIPIFKRLLDYMTRDEGAGKFYLGMAVRFVAVAALIAIPFMTGNAVDAIAGGDMAALQAWLMAALAATAIFIALSAWAETIFSKLATTALYRLQMHLFGHLQTLSLSFFDRQPVGELMSRVSNDSEAISIFYESAVSQLIRAGMQLLLLLVVMFFLNWQMTLAALLIVPVMLGLSAIIERVATPAFAKMQEEMGELSGFQEETLAGHKVIIANRRNDWAAAANEAYAKRVFDVGSHAFFSSLLQTPVTMASATMMIILVLTVGGLLVANGQLSVGEVIAFMGYAGLLASPLSIIANLTSTVLNAIAGGRRVFAIIDEQPAVKDAPDAKDYEFKGGHILFEDVDFSYTPGRKILRHNTFEAKPGQKIGICGPTGAGKSTIINILTRYYDVDSGRIVIDGQPLEKLTQRSLREQVGVVLQEAYLFSDTVMNNLKYARKGATDEECIAAAKQANAHEFIMNLPQGYDTMLTERGANLSQGQRQMITIARAMVAQPKILILDEATSNVDTRTEKLINEGLARLMEGRTSFVIAHRLSTIQDSDRILVLNAGEIIEQGTHDELMARRGFYYDLYMSQFKGKGP